MSAQREDAGLDAVARVRGVREQDDRIGLQLALTEARGLHARAEQLEGMLTEVPTDSLLALTPQELLAHRIALGRVGEAAREAAHEAQTADVVSAEARVRWEAAKTRLAAVERLLEVRVARRRTAAERARAKEADDLAAQRWLRARTVRPEVAR
ncbi:hypothetical protein [Nocardioides stalactiti]|uniref:hypothetical protein n=1 Tax=Nocardioides stalactiti TaxID=2755356 RepID=UPI0016031936|nr:hypothetical protein [Nocardioides stalactiti]